MDKKELIEIINAVIESKGLEQVKDVQGKLRSDNLDKLAPALSAMQGKYKTVLPTRKNPRFNSDYAELDSILGSVRKLMPEFGFSLIQCEETYDGIRYLRTTLLHNSGQYIAAFIEIVPDNINKNVVQAYGSALSYHKRYSAQSLLGITVSKDPYDNDGEPMEEQGKAQAQTQAKTQGKAQTQKKEILLSEREVDFINNRVRGHEDIKNELLKTLRKPSIDKCLKSMFDVMVEFIDNSIKVKKNNRLN